MRFDIGILQNWFSISLSLWNYIFHRVFFFFLFFLFVLFCFLDLYSLSLFLSLLGLILISTKPIIRAMFSKWGISLGNLIVSLMSISIGLVNLMIGLKSPVTRLIEFIISLMIHIISQISLTTLLALWVIFSRMSFIISLISVILLILGLWVLPTAL